MDSDESGHGESEFYYPGEETLNQKATPINRDEVEQDRHLNNIQEKKMLFNGLGRFVWEKKTVPLVLNTRTQDLGHSFKLSFKLKLY